LGHTKEFKKNGSAGRLLLLLLNTQHFNSYAEDKATISELYISERKFIQSWRCKTL